MLISRAIRLFFFFNDTATTEIYTLSLHDALPIYYEIVVVINGPDNAATPKTFEAATATGCRSEEHTSELQSHLNLVCRLLLEKKKSIGSEPLCGRLRDLTDVTGARAAHRGGASWL